MNKDTNQVLEQFKEFLIFCKKRLGLKKLPKIHWNTNDDVGISRPSFGSFENETQEIRIGIKNRHPLDVMRTLAHELTHYKQFLKGELKPNSGETGSPQENQANSVAGIIMRDWNAAHESMFKQEEIDEATTIFEAVTKKNVNQASEQEQIAYVQRDPERIQYITNPSEAVQLAAVKRDGWAIRYITNPSEGIKLAAVKQDGDAIRFIKNPSEVLQLAAVKENGDAIRFIENHTKTTEAVQIAAVKQSGDAIQHIKNPTKTVILTAILVMVKYANDYYDGTGIKYYREFKSKYPDWPEWAAIDQSLRASKLINESDPINEAVTRRNVNKASEEEQIAYVTRDPKRIKYITNPSEAVQLAAVKQDPLVMYYIRNSSEAVQLAAVNKNGYTIEYIQNPTEAVQLAAVNKRGTAIEYIKNPTKTVILTAILVMLKYANDYYDGTGIKYYSKFKSKYPDWPEWAYIDKALRASKLIKESQNADKIPEEVWEFLDSLNANDVGKERIGDYIVHFEGFSEECQNDAAERTQLPASDPRHLQNYDDVYDEVIGDFISRENGNVPVSKGMVGDEFFPIVYAVFRKPIIDEGQLNRIDQFEYDGGSLEGYVVDTDQPQLENYLTAQGASQSLIKALQSRYKRISIVRNMWVDEELRGGGIGSDMLKAAIGDAFSFGADAVLLVADRAEDNSHLGKTLDLWYEGFGFRTIGSAGGDPVMVLDKELNESWSKKYKKSINCSHPKGFSQKAHCAGRRARQAGKKTKSSSVSENFADGKGPGKPGDSQRHGIPKGATIAQLEKAAKAKGRKGQLARWQLNMRRGRAKNESVISEGISAFHSSATSTISKFNSFSHFGTEAAAVDRIKNLIKQKRISPDALITIYTVDLNIENPLMIRDYANVQHSAGIYAGALKDKKIIDQDTMVAIRSNTPYDFNPEPKKSTEELAKLWPKFEKENLSTIKKILKSKGYDGLVYKNKAEDKGSLSYVILDPNQVRITGKKQIPAKELVKQRNPIKEDDQEKLLDKPTPTIGDLAEKYHTSLLAVEQQLIIGIEVEIEHTTKRGVAREIALDHLSEDLFYYKKLKRIEKKK